MTPRDSLAGVDAWMPPRPAPPGSRPAGRRRLLRAVLVVTLAGTGLMALAGCDPRMALYFLQPWEPTVPALGPSLKGKRVVVITKARGAAMNDFPTIDRELTREFVATLRNAHGKKIDVVDPDKVLNWAQAHPTWSDPAELAEAFDADHVIVFELGRFQIQNPSSPAMYQGFSNVHIHVVERAHPTDPKGKPITDLPQETRTIYESDKDSVFPTHTPMPASSEVSPTAFKNKFLKLVATELSWHFVDHAPGDSIQDTNFHGP